MAPFYTTGCCSLHVVVLILNMCCLITGQTLLEAQTAYNTTFSGYNKDIRPLQNDYSQAVVVNLTMELIAVDSYNTVTEILSLVVILHITWRDEILTWTPATYGGLTQLKVGQSSIWLPELYNLKVAEKFEPMSEKHYRAILQSDGTVLWSPGALLKVKCDADVTKFPFDVQKCTVMLSPWGYGATEVKLLSSASTLDKSYFQKNGEWSVLDTSAEHDSSGSISVAMFNITMQRQSTYHVLNTIFPIFILLVLNPLVFVLPADSGERVTFSLTILLSFTILLIVIEGALPKSSDPMSVLTYFMAVTLSFSSFIAFLTIVQLNIYHRSNEVPVPQCFVKFIRFFRFRIKCRSSETEVEEIGGEMLWKEVARFFDTMYAVVSYFLIVLQILTTMLFIKFSPND